jgi:hypothetical protein
VLRNSISTQSVHHCPARTLRIFKLKDYNPTKTTWPQMCKKHKKYEKTRKTTPLKLYNFTVTNTKDNEVDETSKNFLKYYRIINDIKGDMNEYFNESHEIQMKR